MKTIFACLITCSLSLFSWSQSVETVSLKLSELITYVADQLPMDEPSQLLLLVEAPSNTWTMEHQFYLSQSLQLIQKRMKPEDELALILYGSYNQEVLSLSRSVVVKQVLDDLGRILNRPVSGARGDGIDIAFTVAENQRRADYQSKVLLIRNDVTPLAAKPPPIKSVGEGRAPKKSLGGTLAVTALGILPEVLAIIKD
ncbi:hypothetical protein [Croceiramulus getboli]|nr:hypothetical protein P8624_00340 [Flavobacteriaceae bacterium YJPT1-3]